MEITRDYQEKERCYNYYFRDGNKIFSIIFGGVLDLFWTIHELKDSNNNLLPEEIKKERYSESKYTFVITKENYFIYSLFDDLYNEVKDSRIFIPTTETQNEEEINKMNEWYKTRDIYQMLFDGETIEWHSDDETYPRSDRVSIKKCEDKYILEFTCPKIEDDDFIFRLRGSASIRFRNSGSRYDPYNVIFMRMFHKLQEYNPEYHQIHIEELSHQKKLTLKK